MYRSVLAVAILAAAVTTMSAACANAQTFTFTAMLNSGQEVPPNTSKVLGVAFVTFNAQTQEVCFSISYEDFNLTSPETAAHFHFPAPPGVNAPVRIFLPAGAPKNDCATADPPLEIQDITDLFSGRWYMNIHTQMNPGGEIRGQVLPQAAPVF
jgi:CHRD domain